MALILLGAAIIGLAVLVAVVWAACILAGRADRAWERILRERK